MYILNVLCVINYYKEKKKKKKKKKKLWVRSFLLSIYIVYYVLRTYQRKIMRILSQGLVFYHGLSLRALLFVSEHGSPTIKTSRQFFSIVTHSIQVFGSLQAQYSGLGHCKRDSD